MVPLEEPCQCQGAGYSRKSTRLSELLCFKSKFSQTFSLLTPSTTSSLLLLRLGRKQVEGFSHGPFMTSCPYHGTVETPLGVHTSCPSLDQVMDKQYLGAPFSACVIAQIKVYRAHWVPMMPHFSHSCHLAFMEVFVLTLLLWVPNLSPLLQS